ncbi:hypothetical protein ACQEVG_09730 [Streptomyces sp. CA-135486]|uniref:hypothetical protein n=1 Tax=Streptomyces sp. CA-135486 TaxID=3240049 RepID=UPI003D8DD007
MNGAAGLVETRRPAEVWVIRSIVTGGPEVVVTVTVKSNESCPATGRAGAW